MTIERTLRIDRLGHETQFVVIDDCITEYGRAHWEAHLTKLALGYTKLAARGGWRGVEEATTIYRVASLTREQAIECAEFLLDARWSPAIGRIMRDVYVILAGGETIGACYEYPDFKIDLPTYHGMVEPVSETDKLYYALTGRLHGTRDTGWSKPGERMPLASDAAPKRWPNEERQRSFDAAHASLRDRDWL
jgi:hypothetical protein